MTVPGDFDCKFLPTDLVRVEQLEIRLDALQQVVCTALKPSHCPGIELMIINFGVSAAWVWIGCVIPIIARTPNDVLFFAELTATAERIDEGKNS